MLDEKLLSKDYYMSKLSMFMQQSYGIDGQIAYFTEFIQDIDTVCDWIASIYNLDSLEELIKTDPFSEDGYECEPLETVADIMNISRSVTIVVDNVNETLKLNNLELLLYIKFMILKSNFNGTRKSLMELYNDTLSSNGEEGILMLTDPHNPLTCNLWLNTNSSYLIDHKADNFIKLFLYSDIFIESLGVKYIKNTTREFEMILVLYDLPISTEVDYKTYVKKSLLYPEKVFINKPTTDIPKYYFETPSYEVVGQEPMSFYFGTTGWYDENGNEITSVSDFEDGKTYYLDWEMIEAEDIEDYQPYPTTDEGNEIYITSNIQRLG